MAAESQLHLEDENPNFDLDSIVRAEQVLLDIMNGPLFSVEKLNIMLMFILYDNVLSLL